MYEFDRTAHEALSFEEANNRNVDINNERSVVERLRMSTYLIKIAYGYEGKPFPPLDKSCFEILKRDL
jgi:hypothetical protein